MNKANHLPGHNIAVLFHQPEISPGVMTAASVQHVVLLYQDRILLNDLEAVPYWQVNDGV